MNGKFIKYITNMDRLSMDKINFYPCLVMLFVYEISLNNFFFGVFFCSSSYKYIYDFKDNQTKML